MTDAKALPETLVFDGFEVTITSEGNFEANGRAERYLQTLLREVRAERARKEAEEAQKEAVRRELEKSKKSAERPVMNRDTRGRKPVKPVLETIGERSLYLKKRRVVRNPDRTTHAVGYFVRLRLTGLTEDNSGRSFREKYARLWGATLTPRGEWVSEKLERDSDIFVATEEEIERYKAALAAEEVTDAALTEFFAAHLWKVNGYTAGRVWDRGAQTYKDLPPRVVLTSPDGQEVTVTPEIGLVVVPTEGDVEGEDLAVAAYTSDAASLIHATAVHTLLDALASAEAPIHGLVNVNPGRTYSARWIEAGAAPEHARLSAAADAADRKARELAKALRLTDTHLDAYAEALEEYRETLHEWTEAGKR